MADFLSSDPVRFQFSTRSKQQALDGLSLLLEQRRIKFPYIQQIEEEMLGYEDDDKDLVQDCVMALAMASLHVAPRLWVA